LPSERALRFLMDDELLMHHELVIEEYGGAMGVRNRDGVSAVVDGARTAWEYTGDLYEVAAAYILYVNQRHPFA